MSDLISRSALNELLDDLCVVDSLYDAINKLPTVDAVPVELIQKLENPYNPIEYQQAFAGFETAKCQLILKHGKKVK